MDKQAIHRVTADSKSGRRLISRVVTHHAKPAFLQTPEERERAGWNARVDAQRKAKKAGGKNEA
jgi:hypothetical protein